MGQFKVPFGFEVLQSSGDRELPERAAVIRALFPGERDRGLRLQYIYDFFRLQAAVINGNFINGDDPRHLRPVELEGPRWPGGRRSGYRGRRRFRARRAGSCARHGSASMAMPVAGYERFSRFRARRRRPAVLRHSRRGRSGPAGRGHLGNGRADVFGGVEPAPDRCKDVDRFGWYATLVQNLGDMFALAVRYDQYDPTASLADECDAMATMTAADRDRQRNLGVALLAYISGNLKATLAYDHLRRARSRSERQRRAHRAAAGEVLSARRCVQAIFQHEGDYRCVSRSCSSSLLLTAAPLAASAAPVTVKGSDTMVILGQRWAEEYMQKNPNNPIQVTGGGSGTGISALINGTTDICQSSRAMKPAEKAKLRDRYNTTGVEIPVARDGLAVYVHSSNPMTEISMSQLKDIFVGKLTNWKDVGGPDDQDHRLLP